MIFEFYARSNILRNLHASKLLIAFLCGTLAFPVFALDVTSKEKTHALKVFKSYIAAIQSGDFDASIRQTDPELIALSAKRAGMTAEQLIEFGSKQYEKTVDKSAIIVSPDYDRAAWHETPAGRPYLKVPVYTKINAGLLFKSDGIMTYLVYRNNGHWYPVDLKRGPSFRQFKRYLPDFRSLKLYPEK